MCASASRVPLNAFGLACRNVLAVSIGNKAAAPAAQYRGPIQKGKMTLASAHAFPSQEIGEDKGLRQSMQSIYVCHRPVGEKGDKGWT